MVDQMALRIDDRFDRVRRRLQTLGRKNLVRRGELEQRGLVGANRDRQHRGKVLVDAHFVRGANYRRGAEHVADVRGRHVERFEQRLRHRHLRLIIALVVRGRPSVERHRLVGQRRRQRQRRRERRAVGIECGQVDNRFEGRPGLALGVGGAIKLALRVVAPANHRANRAAVGVQRDHRGLQPAVNLRAAQAAMVLLELSDIFRDRIDGVALKFGVERRVNLESLEMAVEAGNLAHERGHVVGEIRRAAQSRRLGDLNRRGDARPRRSRRRSRRPASSLRAPRRAACGMRRDGAGDRTASAPGSFRSASRPPPVVTSAGPWRRNIAPPAASRRSACPRTRPSARR